MLHGCDAVHSLTMVPSPEFESAFARARHLHAQGRLTEAERLYRQLAAPGRQREIVLNSLAELYWQARRPKELIHTLDALLTEQPDSLRYCAMLADVLDRMGRTEEALDRYRRLLLRNPRMAAAHFNAALLYKKLKRYRDALNSYEQAVRLGIEDVQEVYSNMGVLFSEMRAAGRAREMYRRALEVDPHYVPALFNLAALHEEAGERPQALELYRRILALEPGNGDALARLAQASPITSVDDPLVGRLKAAIGETKDALVREGLYFALGKVMDDLGRYDEAFAAYRAANELGKLRNWKYDHRAVEHTFERIIEVFDPDWMKEAAARSSASPIFICGMFRSGSTLVEQILAAHPAVTPGGELDYLPWLVTRRLSPYPQRVRHVTLDALQQLADEYVSRVSELFPQAGIVTDKRPDNFLYLGLIRVLFPSARIIYTKRNPLDNCLSIYFQQLGGDLFYATDLENIAHYYRQHERLMRHWFSCMGESMFTVDYDELVRSPRAVMEGLLRFLGLPWDERCLQFERVPNLVKTASIWQVREVLHARSSGRWRNYEAFLTGARALLNERGAQGTVG